jgi:hypothetical protein
MKLRRLAPYVLAAFGVATAHAQWSYKTKRDSMRDTNVVEASTKSLNQHQFENAGSVRATLVLRQRGAEEPDVLLHISRGQFACTEDPCIVRLRFDETMPEDYGGSLPSDQSANSIFIGSETVFFEKIKKANHLKIETAYFQEGTRVFEFDLKALVWPIKQIQPAKK